MSIVLVGSTSGSITLQEPAIAGTTVLTLPAVTGNVLTDTSPKAGNVLQVVNATFGTLVGSTTTAWVDTGLTASITPTSTTSKILILVNQNGIAKDASNTGVALQILRNATSITQFSNTAAFTADASANRVGSVSTSFLDSPATTSAITYKTQFNSSQNSANAYVNVDGGGSVSTITLMEIAG